MKPFFVLIVVFVVSNLSTLLLKGTVDYFFSGKIALAVMLLFTSLGHLLYTEGMTLMLPEFIPFKKEMIYATGLLEALAAIGLFVPQVSRMTGILLLFFFLLVLPTNIRANLKHINYETATFDGPGPN